MPTARELLEQADALMRRNRGDTGIPVLTDIVPDATPLAARSVPAAPDRPAAPLRAASAEALALRERGLREEQRRAQDSPRAAGPAPAVEPPRRPPEPRAQTERGGHEAEPPLLTDAVDDRAGALSLPRAEADASPWLGPDTIDPALHSITGPAPDTVAVVPPVTLRAPVPTAELPVFSDDPDPTVTRTLRAAGSAPTPPPQGSLPPGAQEIPAVVPVEEPTVAEAEDDERWRALAEQISMQVLQRLDLFIDTGLKAQLASHLHPIVARASAELVEAINDHVGQLVRTYVADAIEREIAQWREDNK